MALGIDTGGTLTDGVLLDLDSKKILVAGKVSTTRHDLSLAVDACLSKLIDQTEPLDLTQLKMVSLSTTLATNAIVEGRGAEVGLLMIGFAEAPPKLPTTHVAAIKGGCDLKGEYKEEVDLAEAEKAVNELKGRVEAFAVSGYLSIRNPAQELAVAGLVRELTGCPVVCAHQLSSELGYYERTVTAVLNARLIPLITDLITAVKKSMSRRKICAPLVVVKGDGSLISEQVARQRPIETILSGPAASIIGAVTLTGVQDAVVVDMGGTTLDLAVLRKGSPAINRAGAQVGGWFTRVQAAAVTTAGLGGDSFIDVDKKGKLSIGPQRVYPLSGIAAQYPYLRSELEGIGKLEYNLFDVSSSMVLIHQNKPHHAELTAVEKKILDAVREGPHTLHQIGIQLDRYLDLLPWQKLARSGAVLPAAITPTDILHLTGTYEPWDREAAFLGAKILARRFGTKIEMFVDAVLEEIYFKIAALVTGRLLGEEDGLRMDFMDRTSRFFLKKMLERGGEKQPLALSARLNLPLVAVGAPVDAYFPEVATRLGAELLIPPHAEVANAVGTVSGQTVERLTVLIKPDGGKNFIIHAPWGRESSRGFEETVCLAVQKGEEYVAALAAASGAREIELSVDRRDKIARLRKHEDSAEDGGSDELFIESVIEVLAVGRPWC